MTQSSKMNDALIKCVVTPLQDRGFTGEFPHYRRVYDNRIELFTIQKNKWGNSFTIEVSTIYPQREGMKKTITIGKKSIFLVEKDEQITIRIQNRSQTQHARFFAEPKTACGGKQDLCFPPHAVLMIGNCVSRDTSRREPYCTVS